MSGKSTPRGAAPAERWRKLTWDDVDRWAGTRSRERGRSYQRAGHVKGLACAADGALLAWVEGTERYATRVGPPVEGAGLAGVASRCTCPAGGRCKHAVAVVLQCLQALKDGEVVPPAAADDPRRRRLEDAGPAGDTGEDGDGAEDEGAPPARARRGGGAPWDEGRVRAYLENRPLGELVGLVLDQAARDRRLRDRLTEASDLESGEVAGLIRQARAEARRRTAAPAWGGRWGDRGEAPEYGGVRRRLEHLLALGQADAVAELGRELFDRGREQVEQCHDEGETASEIGSCLEVCFRAVLRTSRPDADKLLYALDMVLADPVEICSASAVVLERDWPPAAWSAVADALAGRLAAAAQGAGPADFSAKYARDELSGWLIRALRASGREAEVVSLCEAEAPRTGSYVRLVSELLAAGRTDDAVRRGLEGVGRVGGEWPGVAKQLRDLLREVAAGRQAWPLVAAFQAEELFSMPNVAAVKGLLEAAGRAGCADAVRAAALHFLETGLRPDVPPARRPPRGAPAAPAWPLPRPFPSPEPAPSPPPPRSRVRPLRPAPAPAPAQVAPRTHWSVLLDLALAEGRPDEVLRWYDRIRERDSGPGYQFGWSAAGSYGDRVADAVAATHPERALELYRRTIEGHVANTDPRSYEAARPSLVKMRDLLRGLARAAEWDSYVAELRAQNRRKRRFMDVLDRLDGRPILG